MEPLTELESAFEKEAGEVLALIDVGVQANAPAADLCARTLRSGRSLGAGGFARRGGRIALVFGDGRYIDLGRDAA